MVEVLVAVALLYGFGALWAKAEKLDEPLKWPVYVWNKWFK